MEDHSWINDPIKWAAYKDEKLKEMDPLLLDNAVKFLSRELPEDAKQEIREMHEKDPLHWSGPYHFSWGMGVRNALRKYGLKDDLLPEGNWDDYYVPVVEVAVGVREMPRITHDR